MESVRKTYKYKLILTPTQERELVRVLGLCRRLYNTALEQRIVAYQRRHVSVSRYQQEAELKTIRAEMPEYAAIYSHVLQNVLARPDKTYQAFFRRMQRGENAGFPRYQGRDRWHSFIYNEFGNGATLGNGSLVLSKIGRIAVRWSRPLEGTPKTVTLSREADGWYVCFSCADVPVQPLPPTGRETGIDLGIEAFATLSDGTRIFSPGWYQKAERALKTAQWRVSRRKRGVIAGARRSPYWPRRIRRCVASGRTTTTSWRCASSKPTMSSIMRTCRSATWSGTTTSPRASPMQVGRRFSPS